MFTVKEISRLAGVTPRTLRYYDQIGLLKPTLLGANGYRYYGQDALLVLQQILFYRELDFALDDIKRMIGRPDFDMQIALENHRAELLLRVGRLQKLMETVDNTLLHLKGNKEMSKKQIFSGFSEEEQEKYAAEAEQTYDAAVVRESNRKWKEYSAEKKKAILDEGRQNYVDMVAIMPKGPASPEAQAIVERWRKHMDYFWTPQLEQLTGLAELYNFDPRFKQNFDDIHPELAVFMLEAVKVYVQARK